MKHLFGLAGDDRPECGNMNRIGHVRRRRARLIFLTALLGVSGWIKASENPFVGNWALSLPNGEPGWLGIVETNGVLRGQLLWGTGSIEPIARFTLNEGHLERIIEMPCKAIGSLPGQSNILEFTRQQEDTVLRGGVEVPVVETESGETFRGMADPLHHTGNPPSDRRSEWGYSYRQSDSSRDHRWCALGQRIASRPCLPAGRSHRH